MHEPYYAVIFTSQLSENPEGYEDMGELIMQSVVNQPGFLGMDYARGEVGITVCFWKDMESITNWKNNALHMEAQKKGMEQWYSSYRVRVCKVEKDYSMG